MRTKLQYGALMAIADRKIRGDYGTRKYDDIAFEEGTTGNALRNAVHRYKRMMFDSQEKPPRPEIRYAFSDSRRGISTLNDGPDWGKWPCAVIPCSTLKQARALLQLALLPIDSRQLRRSRKPKPKRK